MGYEKNRRIEEDDQGWSYSDKDICYHCISEPYLRDLARSEASEFECSFCGRISRKKPNSIPFNTLMQVIGETVWQYYDHAVQWDGIAVRVDLSEVPPMIRTTFCTTTSQH
jgi:hypothetical protein